MIIIVILDAFNIIKSMALQRQQTKQALEFNFISKRKIVCRVFLTLFSLGFSSIQFSNEFRYKLAETVAFF